MVHLGIVTVGILIALSFEGALEWSHHRELVREARQNLQNDRGHFRTVHLMSLSWRKFV